MIGLVDCFALGVLGVSGAGVLTLALRRYLSGRAKAVLFAALCAFFLLPAGGLPLLAYLRGALGDLSFGTLLLIVAAWWPGRRAVSSEARQICSWLVVLLAAILLYPLALGAGSLDPYRWGFGAPWFVVAVLFLGGLAYRLRWPLVPAAVALAVLAWSLGIYESRNLWDYLIDPLLGVYAAWRIFVSGLGGRVARRSVGAAQPNEQSAEASV